MGIRIRFECVHDAGDIPKALVWQMLGVGRGRSVGIYIDGRYLTGQRADVSGNIKKTYIIPRRHRASFQNFYMLSIEDVNNKSLARGTVSAYIHVDGKVISFRRR